MSDVKLLARWTGWCDPCETERPLVLTEAGQHGLRAWMRGVGPEDRELTLTCGVCGEWQSVPHDEADGLEPPDAVTVPPVLALQPLGARQLLVRSLPAAAVPASAAAPARSDFSPAAPRSLDSDSVDAALELIAEGLDLITSTPR